MAMRIRHNACPACGNGDLHPLGRLGFLEHYQCRHCGMQTSREIRKVRARRKIEGGLYAHIDPKETI